MADKKKDPAWGVLLQSDPQGVQVAFEARKHGGVVAHPVGGKILVLGYRAVPEGLQALPVGRSYCDGPVSLVLCGEDGRPLPRKGGWWVGDHHRVCVSVEESEVVVEKITLEDGVPSIVPVFEGHILRLPKKFLAAANAGFRWIAHGPARGKDCFVAGGSKKPHAHGPKQEATA